MSGDSDLPQINQRWLVKLGSQTRQKTPSPFYSEYEEDYQRPLVVDMVKPQAPEGAWENNPPSGFDSAEPLPHTSSEMAQPRPRQLAAPVIPHVSKVTPAAGSGEEANGPVEEASGPAEPPPLRNNPSSLFIVADPTLSSEGAEQDTEQDTEEDRAGSRGKGKCVLS